MANETRPEDEQPPNDGEASDTEAVPEASEASEAEEEGGVAEMDGVAEFGSLDGVFPEGNRFPGGEANQVAEDWPPEVAEIAAERDRIRDQHLRLAADFDNYRKRTEGDLRARWDRAQAELIGKLLEPLDDLQRVAAWEPETTSVDAIVEGVDLVERKFLRALEDIGVEMIDPSGEGFDPNTMEAMMRVPTDDPEQDDVVERVFQKGCALKGHLVRPARVSVFKSE